MFVNGRDQDQEFARENAERRRAEDRQRSLLAGYQMHLAKPIEARELVAGIASLLHLRR